MPRISELWGKHTGQTKSPGVCCQLSTGHWITRRNTQCTRNKDLIVLMPHAGPIDVFNGLRTPLHLRLLQLLAEANELFENEIREEAGGWGDNDIDSCNILQFKCNMWLANDCMTLMALDCEGCYGNPWQVWATLFIVLHSQTGFAQQTHNPSSKTHNQTKWGQGTQYTQSLRRNVKQLQFTFQKDESIT